MVCTAALLEILHKARGCRKPKSAQKIVVIKVQKWKSTYCTRRDFKAQVFLSYSTGVSLIMVRESQDASEAAREFIIDLLKIPLTNSSIFHESNETETPTPTSPNPLRPYVTLTFAQSLDAKIAGAHGKQLALSGFESMLMTHWQVLLENQGCIYFTRE